MYTARLLDEELRSELPEDVKVRALCYGAPPVFRHLDGDPHTHPEIVIIQNDKDGIIGASTKTVIDLFNKAVAIDAADIEQDIMIKMIFEKVTNGDDSPDVEETKENESSSKWSWQEIKSTVSDSIDKYRCALAVDPTNWKTVEESLSDRVSENLLYLMGSTVLQMKNIDGNIAVDKFEGLDATSHFSSELKLSKKMFDHHMPWGYDSLFTIPNNNAVVDLNIFDQL